MKFIKFFILSLCLGLVISCTSDKKSSTDENEQNEPAIIKSSPKAEMFSQGDTVKAVAQEVVLAFETKNYAELVKYFSEEGVLFSPYAYLAPRKQVKLTADEFLDALKTKQVFKWGEYDGTGDEIKLPVDEYLKKFVTKATFSEAEAISFDAVMKKGNTIDNIAKVFPKHHYVEYHIPSIDPKYEGMDWTSLRLVFEVRDGEYFLVAVVQDQWTV